MAATNPKTLKNGLRSPLHARFPFKYRKICSLCKKSFGSDHKVYKSKASDICPYCQYSLNWGDKGGMV